MYSLLLKCINKDCRFKARLSKNIPIWANDTPEHLRKIPVLSINKKYVSGYYNCEYCVGCSSVVSVNIENSPLVHRSIFATIRFWIFRTTTIISKPNTIVMCPECSAGNAFLTEDAICPACKTGKVYHDGSMTALF